MNKYRIIILNLIFFIPLICHAQIQIGGGNPSHGASIPAGSCPAGQIYTQDPNGTVYSCNNGTWSLPGAPPPNTAGIPALNGNVFYASNFGVKADTYSVADAVCTNGLPQVTSASAHFLSAKISVGQTMWAVAGAGQGNSAPSVPKTTIKSIDSDTQITANTNGNGGCGASQFLVWGDDDYLAFHNTLEPVYYGTSLLNCGTAYLPAGGIMVSGGVLNKAVPATCNASQTISAPGMIGCGITCSVFYPTPDFDPQKGNTCGSGCFGPAGGVRSGFGIEGGGLSATANPATVFTVIPVLSPEHIWDVSCLYWAGFQANMTGFSTGTGQWEVGPNVEIVNCGATGPTLGGAGNGGEIQGSFFVPAGGQVTVLSSSPGIDFFSDFIGASSTLECNSNTTVFQNIVGNYMGPGAEMCVTGGHVRMNGTILSHNQGIAGRAALKILSSGVVTASNSSFTDTGAGEFSVSVDATSSFTDACGNIYSGAINVASGGIFIVCPGVTYPANSSVLQVAGNFADGAGIGTSTFGAVSGTGYHGQVTITYAGTLATPATFTMTFPTTWSAAPKCTVVDQGGTNPFPTQIDTTTTAVTTTLLTVKMTFAAAPVATQTDVFIWDCRP